MDQTTHWRAAALFAVLLVVCCTGSAADTDAQGHAEPLDAFEHPIFTSWAEAAAHPGFVLDARNIIALLVAFLVASLAASAGVGGGAFFVPLAMVCLNFSLKEATVLSQASIAAVSLASIAFNLRKRHPTTPATKTLINYEVCLTMTPALLLGVSLGVVFNAAFPTWLITTMLITVLTFMAVRTTQKGLQLWRTETVALQQAVPPPSAAAESSQQTGPAGVVATPVSTRALPDRGSNSAAVVVISDAASEGSVGKPKHAPYPWAMALGVLFLWAGFAGLQVLRGSTQRCSPAYFAVCAAQVAFGAGASLVFAYCCIAKPARQAAAAAAAGPDSLAAPLLVARNPSMGTLLEQQHQHQQESMTQLTITAAKVAVAGVVAGILGIGGGMIMAPMLLASGIHPQSASATSNILVFFCSSSATLAFLLDGRVDLQYSAVYCVVCGAASLTGLTLFGRVVKASGRPSIVVLLLAFIMGAGAACSGVFGYIEAWQQAQHGAAGWKSIC